VTAGLDVAVSSSFSEGFPNSIGEAMSCGVPCVVTDVGDLSWIIKNAGIAVPNDDPVSMANAFEYLLNMDQEQREKLGQNGRTRVTQHFCLSAIAQQYASLYESVVAKNVLANAQLPSNVQTQTFPDNAVTDRIKAAV
jgi:glycosyltransferase involved in cell wall biosynthesis